MKKLLAILVLASATALTPVTAKELRIGTGGATGNYFSMTKDIASYCADEVQDTELSILNTEGSAENLMGLGDKRYSVGWVQEDVLQFFNRFKDPKRVNDNRLKVIAAGQEEVFHLLIPKGFSPKSDEKKGWMSSLFDSKSNVTPKVELEMLKGQRVGSWGGSMVSTQALSSFFDLKLQVVEVPKAKRADVVMPLLLVGGAPYKPVEDYLATGKYHLVSLNYERISNRARFYTKQNASYRVDGKVHSIPTIGVRALLIGKSFRKASRNLPMSQLATCIEVNLADLADDPDTNPLWSNVFDLEDAGEQVNWKYFPLLEDSE